ncbi:MAG: hypothetical protein OXB88_02225 [Bacteriovoracales bacterium]|nr:hypothetical protein [Bacteriovoracales bacterium]
METNQNMQEELERLKRENERLKKQKEKGKELSLKVSQKGAVSLYGMGRFPVTLYKEQWLRLLDFSDDIRCFIGEHEGELKTKS